MYELKKFARKAGVASLFALAAGGISLLFGDYGKVFSIVFFVIAGQLMLFFCAGEIVRHLERMDKIDLSDGKLTKSERVRRNIVREFSEKYYVNLNDRQIDLVVRASYSSPEWENEILMMGKEYYTIDEWFVSDVEWLRIYLKVFKEIEVSADFRHQKEIVLAAFEKIIKEPLGQQPDIAHCIDMLNNKYLVVFDEVSFSALCNYMKNQGYKVELPLDPKIEYTGGMNGLKRKYDK